MKKLILCCDGTWQRPEQTWLGRPSPTNVLRFSLRIADQDSHGKQQVVWYDTGVGTGNLVDKVIGGALGAGLAENVQEAYRFLVTNYKSEDEIFLLGFSRGAYTARSIAGMIRKCGILRRDRPVGFAEALALYQNDMHPDDPEPTNFRTRNSVTGKESIPIKLIGVWDTVGALGIPLTGLSWLTEGRYRFHDTELSKWVENGFHALAIDEHRAPFTPTLWAEKKKKGQTIEQVWFSGTHSDVGGGSGSRGLPDLTLEWMISKAGGVGLEFDETVEQALPIQGNPLAPMNRIERAHFWSFLQKRRRTIGILDGRLDGTQTVHGSVIKRWDNDDHYRPSNLREYFERNGDPRALALPKISYRLPDIVDGGVHRLSTGLSDKIRGLTGRPT
jgi:uncharacterized protein (DUF2235 family)